MSSTENTQANQLKLRECDRQWRLAVEQTLHTGFSGSAAVEIVVSNGTIVAVRRRVEEERA